MFKDCTTPETLRRRYLELSATLHPDKGGDAALFSAMRDEYTKELAEAAKRPCASCKGNGKTMTQGTSFLRLEMTCPVCGGSGR